MIDALTAADFTPHLNRSFAIHPAGDAPPLVATLIEVTPLPGHGAAGARAPFSIVLRSAAGPVLPQGIYHVVQPELGTMAIFLVPIGSDGEGICYEALFA